MLIPNGSLILLVVLALMLLGAVLVIALVVGSLSGRGPAVGGPADRLRQLEELRRQGLITEDEFAARRATIIATL